jgi:hypothetical protein
MFQIRNLSDYRFRSCPSKIDETANRNEFEWIGAWVGQIDRCSSVGTGSSVRVQFRSSHRAAGSGRSGNDHRLYSTRGSHQSSGCFTFSWHLPSWTKFSLNNVLRLAKEIKTSSNHRTLIYIELTLISPFNFYLKTQIPGPQNRGKIRICCFRIFNLRNSKK